MQNSIFLVISFFLLILNWLISYFLPPNGIFLTPFFISIIIFLISIENTLYTLFEIKNTLKAIWKSIFSALFICMQDIGINLYAGGTHDTVGKAIILLFFIGGLFQGTIILTVAISIDKKYSLKSKVISILVFTVLIAIYSFWIR